MRSPYACQVSRVEMLDEVMVKGINLATGRELPEKPTLMFEFVGTGWLPLILVLDESNRRRAFVCTLCLRVEILPLIERGRM